MTSVMFVSDEKRETIRRLCEGFRARSPIPTEEVLVETTFGATHALVTGPKDAPPLVVLHGALASSAHLLPELAGLLRTRRVYAVDVVGQSAWSEDRRIDVRGDDYGRWLVEACDALGLSQWDLLGVSWGGFVALRAALVAPARIRRLVLVVPAGVVANGFWAGLRDAGWAAMTYRMFPSDARLDRMMRALFTTIAPPWTEFMAEAMRAYRLDMRIPPAATAPELARIACPTLVFAAEHDASFPGVALLDRLKAHVPQIETELVEGAKHSPPQTEEFRAWLAARVDRFLGAVVDDTSVAPARVVG